MGRIIHVPFKQEDDIMKFLKETAEFMVENGAENIVLAAKDKDGNILTCYYNCSFGVKQELCGHIQVDIVDQMIRSNYEGFEEG